MKRTIASFAALALAAASLAGCARITGQTTQAGKPTVRLIANTWVGYSPLYLARELGYFADEGVNVEILPIEDIAQKKASLLSGRVDAVADTLDSFVLMANEDIRSSVVGQLDISLGADGVMATNDIKTIKDLKGRTVAMQRNFISESFLNYLLIKNGLKPTDVTPLDMEGGAAGAAFVAGTVDAAVTFEPWLSKAKERPDGTLLTSSRDEPGVIVDVLIVRNEFLQENPDAVRGVLAAWFRAVDYAKKNPTEAYAIMAPFYKVTPEEFAGFLDGLVWNDAAENLRYFTSGKAIDVAETFTDVFLTTGQIEEKQDIGAMIDTSLLREINDR